MGWTVANLALSAFEFKDTHMMFGQWDKALRNIGWGADWLMKAHVTASDTPTANVFVGQVCMQADQCWGRHVLTHVLNSIKAELCTSRATFMQPAGHQTVCSINTYCCQHSPVGLACCMN